MCYHNSTLFLKGELINETLLRDINDRVDIVETNTQNRRNAMYYGITFDNTDCTEKLQEFFTQSNGKPIYFPSGKVKFSKPILLPKNVDVVCENETENISDNQSS